MHKQILMSGPAEKLRILSLACSVTETAAPELCGSPSQGFQMGKVCVISSLFQLCSLTGYREDLNKQALPKHHNICDELCIMKTAA